MKIMISKLYNSGKTQQSISIQYVLQHIIKKVLIATNECRALKHWIIPRSRISDIPSLELELTRKHFVYSWLQLYKDCPRSVLKPALLA